MGHVVSKHDKELNMESESPFADPFGFGDTITKVIEECDKRCRWRREHCEHPVKCSAEYGSERQYNAALKAIAEKEAQLADEIDGNIPGMIRRTDGVVLFKTGLSYHVIAGGDFGKGRLFEKLKDELANDGIVVEQYLDNPKAYGARKKQVGADVVYGIVRSGNEHLMWAEGPHGLVLGGARENAAADVVFLDGKLVFTPPSAHDGLSDKEEKILASLEAAGKWVSAPELAKLVQAEYAKPGKTGGFGEKVVKKTLEALVKLGEAKGPIRRKYKYLKFEE